jgi:hypothetical protein
MGGLLALVALLAGGLQQGRSQGPASHQPPPDDSPRGAPPQPTAAVRVPPALLVKIADTKPSEPLAVAKVDVQVVITGFLAETTTTLTFRNDYGRVLEGDLVFPLPEGSTVSGYAVDVQGEMVDGVVVEQHEARVAFEQEVRKGVDPGLVEWVQGNSFRTRVWPIPAHGSRTVRLQYVSDLLTHGDADNREALYQLPLRFRTPIREFLLKVEVVKGPAKPEVREGGLANFRFDRWEDRYVARTEQSDVRFEQDLLIALPQVPRQTAVVETGEDGESYFVINDFPEVRTAERPAGLGPRRVGVFWDASLSRQSADKRRELAVLEGWLKRVGDVDLDLVVFRNTPEAPRAFAVRGGNASEALDFLRALAYDGGTDLSVLRFAKGHDFDLLFTDGLGSLGGKLPQVLDVPVYPISPDLQADHALLTHIARRSGGEAFNLQRLADAEVIGSLGVPPFAFLSVDAGPGTVADVLPNGRTPVHGRFTLTGRLRADEAELTLHYGVGAPAESRRYTLRRADAVAGRIVPRFWAQQRAADLSVLSEQNHDELLRLGRRFGIVTPGASLLVLETVDQYVQHGIEPPRTRPQARAEYLRRLQEQQVAEKRKEADKLGRVIAMWKSRVEWWEREFKYEAGVRQRASREEVLASEEGVDEGGVPGGVVGGVVGGLPEATAPARAPSSTPRPSLAAPMERAASRSLQRGAAPAPDATVAGKDVARPPAGGATIVLKPWDPDTPYLTAIRRAGPSRAYQAYLAERKAFGGSPAFYLDCADYFLREGPPAIGLRILTNIPELQLEEPRLLRVAAHRLQQVGEIDLAIGLFEKVLRLRPEEPQSLRDLALALEARADARLRKERHGSRLIAADYLRAIKLLSDVVMGEWDARFPEIEVIALEEANRMIAVLDRDPGFGHPATPIDARLRRPLDVDVRIALTWDTDQTDMDLWVVEPSGEKCFYSHPLTTIGGMISHDFTSGYGPEEYLARRALRGEYQVKANFYGSRSQTLTGPTTVQAVVITNFGRPEEERQAMTLRLTTAREVVDVGTLRFSPAGKTP